MKNLQTMNFGSQQPQLQFPSQKRCLLLINERKQERKAMDMEGNEREEVITSYDYDGAYLDVAAPTENAVIESVKTMVLQDITAYDTSEAVNSFTLQGKQMWLPKETRVGLMNSLSIEKAAGKTETVLWFGNESYILPIDTAMQMLSALELYALDCYNVTAAHKADIEALTTVEEVVAYDYESDYPAKLNF